MSEQEVSSPEVMPPLGARCTDIFSDTLRGYAGIEQAAYDYDTRKLELQYDPRVITPEQAVHLVQRAGEQASSRVLQCRSKSDEMCAACAAHMSGELARYFRTAQPSIVPVTQYEQGRLEYSSLKSILRKRAYAITSSSL